MSCCFSCSAADAQPIPISSPPPPSSITVQAVEEEEEEKVKEVVVVLSQTEIPSPPQLQMKDHIVKQLLLNKQKPPLPLPPPATTNITAAPQFQRTASVSPLKQRRPSRRTHSFSGDLRAVISLSPNQTQPPSRSQRHSGSLKIVQSNLNKDNYNHPGETSGRRLAAISTMSQRTPSMRRTTQLSPIKGRSNKRVEKELKAKRRNGSADTPSVSLECFIFL